MGKYHVTITESQNGHITVVLHTELQVTATVCDKEVS